MFTGIIEATGEVLSLRPTPAGRRLILRAPGLLEEIDPGSSLAVDGCCLTVSSREPSSATFDVVPATLTRTTLGSLGPGQLVNLERALPLGGRLDGHLVQGHVDGVAVVQRVERGGSDGWLVTVGPGPAGEDLTRWMIPCGSVALAGVSLTVARLEPPRFTVALIPETRERTTLERVQPGERLNVEVDLLGRYVHRFLERSGALPRGEGLSRDGLREAGFEGEGEHPWPP